MTMLLLANTLQMMAGDAQFGPIEMWHIHRAKNLR
jgi:hypothetical protein